MKRTAEDIMKMIQDQDIKMIDFKIVDIHRAVLDIRYRLQFYRLQLDEYDGKLYPV